MLAQLKYNPKNSLVLFFNIINSLTKGYTIINKKRKIKLYETKGFGKPLYWVEYQENMISCLLDYTDILDFQTQDSWFVQLN
jgi:hypothetical protein